MKFGAAALPRARKWRNRLLRPWSAIADVGEQVVDVQVDGGSVEAVLNRVSELGLLAYLPSALPSGPPQGRAVVRLVIPVQDALSSGRVAAGAAGVVNRLVAAGIPARLHSATVRGSTTRHAAYEDGAIVGVPTGRDDDTRFFAHPSLMRVRDRQRLVLLLGVAVAGLAAWQERGSARSVLVTGSITFGLSFVIAAGLEVRTSDWRRAAARTATVVAAVGLLLGAVVRDRIVAFYRALGVDADPSSGPALLTGQPVLVVVVTVAVVASLFLIAVTARRGRRLGQPSLLINVVPTVLVATMLFLVSSIAEQPARTAQALRSGQFTGSDLGLLRLPAAVPVLPLPASSPADDPLGPGAWLRIAGSGGDGPTFIDMATGRVVGHAKDAPNFAAVDRLIVVGRSGAGQGSAKIGPGVVENVALRRTPFTLGLAPVDSTCTVAVSPLARTTVRRVGAAVSVTIAAGPGRQHDVAVTCQGRVVSRLQVTVAPTHNE